MCDHCGCGKVEGYTVHAPDGQGAQHHHAHTDETGQVYWHTHDHQHAHTHAHPHREPHGIVFDTGATVLALNDKLAERNRGFLRAKGVRAINLVSSAGAGKTMLLEATAGRLAERLPCAVVVGDLETERDAERLRARGVLAVQITTGTVCHLDAQMVASALDRLALDGTRLVFIENVGNLVCPASYDLGEDCRVVLLAVTEGEDKPLKYPPIFHHSAAVVISKTDLAGPTGFDFETARRNIAQVAPRARIFELSAKTGDGLDQWCAFLEEFAATRPGLAAPQ